MSLSRWRVAVALIFGFGLGGCVLSSGPHRGYQSTSYRSSPPACHPSQYWDGHECRHKGQGYGARKHDGEDHHGHGHGHGHDFD